MHHFEITQGTLNLFFVLFKMIICQRITQYKKTQIKNISEGNRPFRKNFPAVTSVRDKFQYFYFC